MVPSLDSQNGLQVKKFEGADFKYGKSILKFPHKDIQKKAVLVLNLKIFIFALKFDAFKKIRGCWF